LLKRVKAVDVLPTNHTIHARLIKELPPEKINPFFEKLALPNEVVIAMPEEQQDEPEYGFCDIHTDRVRHFICFPHKDLCCRVCVEKNHVHSGCNVADLYEMNQSLVKDIVANFFERREGDEGEYEDVPDNQDAQSY